MAKKTFANAGTCGKTPRWLAYVMIVILLGVLVALVYQWFVARKVRELFEQGAPLRMIFVHMDGCGHCDRFKPAWDEFVQTHGGELRIKGVSVEDFDRADPEWASLQINVNGFPTVLMIDANTKATIATFENDRTVDNLYKWALANATPPSA